VSTVSNAVRKLTVSSSLCN